MAEEWIDTIEEEEPQFEHFRLNIDAGQEPMRVINICPPIWKDFPQPHTISHKNGYVMVGEKTVKANYIVRPGDVIRFVGCHMREGAWRLSPGYSP